jgi:hypothetical protein
VIITHDTINEALASRYILEKYFKNECLDENFRTRLTVVTSKCHERRTRWIFDQVFLDIHWVELEFDSSKTTEIEIKQKRDIVEQNIINGQNEKILHYGGLVKFINNLNKSKQYTKFAYVSNGPAKYQLCLNE